MSRVRAAESDRSHSSETDAPLRVAVGLCDGLGGLDGSLDLEALCRSLERTQPGVRAEVVAGLCRSPEQTRGLAARTGAERLVFGLCAEAASRREFQRWVRKAGLDPFAFELVRLPAGRPRDVPVLLAAAIARARAFAGSEPEQLRPRLLLEEARLSRRAMLTLPPFAYEAVPSVGRHSCLGARRCGLCVQACPAAAIREQEGEIVVDKELCRACGRCLVACPVDAIGFPGSSLPQYEAEIATLLRAERPALLFACRTAAALRGGPAADVWPPSGWLPVEVPCLGMVTPGWALQALAGGAEAVGLLSCGRNCRSCAASVLEERVAYVQALLQLLGDESATERVRFLSTGREPGGAPRVGGGSGRAGADGITLSEPAATVGAVLALGEHIGRAERFSLAHRASPLGLVRLREETCTTCGTCASACPTGALALDGDGDELALSFDATRCVACGLCVLACPEAADGTLRSEPVTDLVSLASGRVILTRATLSLCRSCGRPIAPRRMLTRMRELLGGEPGAEHLFGILSELCADCRLLAPPLVPLPAPERDAGTPASSLRGGAGN